MRLLRSYGDLFFLLCISFYVLFFWFVDGIDAALQNDTAGVAGGDGVKGLVEDLFRAGRGRDLYYTRMIGCAVQYDTGCFVSVAEDFLETKKNELLAQADEEVLRTTGRKETENSPSQIAKSIEKLIVEMANLFKNGIGGLLNPKDGEDELEEEESAEEEQSKDSVTSRQKQEGRGKKKKKKQQLLHKLKLLLIGAAIAAKICMLLKLAQTALLLKLVLVGMGIFAVNIAKLIALWKVGKQKTIYYENSHHDHHYDHEDVWGHDDHDWDREAGAQNLAYSKQTHDGWSLW